MNKLNATFDIKGIEPEYYLGDPLICTLCITPNEDLEVGTLTCKLISEVRGLVAQHAESLYTAKIQVDNTLLAGKTYEFPFSIYNKYKVSYLGHAVSHSLMLAVTSEDGPTSIMDKVKSGFGRRNELISREVIFKKPLNYTVKNNAYQLEAKFGIHAMAIGFIALITGIVGIAGFCRHLNSSESTMIFSVSSYVLLVFSGFAVYFFIHYLVGKTTVKVSNSENDELTMEVSNSMNWRFVSEIKASYSVIEQVIDRRGTTNTTVEYPIYSSELREIIMPTNNFKITFPYPDYTFPGNNDLKDTTFIPTINMKMTTPFGMKHYKAPFSLITEIA